MLRAPSALVRQQVSLRHALLRHQPRRGKALTNFKRPSMDEYGVPTQPWSQVVAKENQRWNLQLLVGFVALVGTVSFGFMSGNIFLNTTPWHLIKNQK